MSIPAPRIPLPTANETAMTWLMRAGAALCLMFGIFYWIRLVGIHPGTQWRFDLMPAYWQVTAPSLAVLFPLAGVGLWMLAAWGPVIWFICAAIETIMYFGFPDLFGERLLPLFIHLVIAAIYIALRVLIWREESARSLTNKL